MIVDLIGNTTTTTGLTVHCVLDTDQYPTGITYTAKDVDTLPITRHEFHGEWNYTVEPTRPKTTLRYSSPYLTPGHSLSQTKLIHSEPISPRSVGTRLPTFPARAADQAHAASMPDTTWPETGLPARPCSHSPANGHGFDATLA